MKPRDRGRDLLDGTLWGFLAESLFPLTGLLTASFLTRRLLPEGYGVFTLVASLVAWVEWTVTSVFSRTTLKLIAEAEDWRPLGTTLVRWHLYLGVVAAAGIAALAGPLAQLLGEPEMTTYLRLMALEIPLFSVAQAHRNILTGTGGFRQRAVTSVWRWTARLVFIVVLVQLGFSVTGAIVGNLAASLVELIVVRYYCHPPLVSATPFPASRLTDYAVPLFVSTLCIRLFDVQILLMLKLCGGTAAEVGLLGAAANLAILPRLFTLSFTPLLVATLTHLQRDGQVKKARDICRDSLRLGFFLLPVAGLTAGAGGEITRFIFGRGFEAAGILFAWQIFGVVALVVLNTCASILTATDRPAQILYFALPLVMAGAVANLLVIPRWRAEGAVIAMTGCATFGAVVALVVVGRTRQIWPSFVSLARSAVITAGVFALSVHWPVAGAWLLLKLTLLFAFAVGSFFLLREFTPREVALARSFLPWNRSAPS